MFKTEATYMLVTDLLNDVENLSLTSTLYAFRGLSKDHLH